jgi:hypothetical protein
MKNLILLIMTLICCISCSKGAKKKLGLAPSGPNEYAVKKYQKLKIPSEFTLPEVEYQEEKSAKPSINKDSSDDILKNVIASPQGQ